MGNPVVVAAQMAAHGDEVARLRADLLAARADAAEQSRLRVEAETAAVQARGERDRLAARVRELEYTLAACKDLGAAADSTAVALLRRAVNGEFLGSLTHGQAGDLVCNCDADDGSGPEHCLAVDVERFLADARAFLGVSRG